jgi:hypothetical protein
MHALDMPIGECFILFTRGFGCMAYEWDARRARRAYLLKFAAAWAAAIVVTSFPVMIVVNAITF